MFCSNCGAPMRAHHKFCSTCGEAASSFTEQQAPASARVATPASAIVPSSSFRDPTTLTTYLQLALIASIVISATAFVSGALQYQLLSDFDHGVYESDEKVTFNFLDKEGKRYTVQFPKGNNPDRALRFLQSKYGPDKRFSYVPPPPAGAVASNDKRQKIIGLLHGCVAIVTVVLFALWIYRANSNSRALGAQNMQFTPGWSVGFYFIPILWFWKPYQAMKEIWRTSKSPASWESVTRGGVLPWWWFFFLVSAFFSNALARTGLGAKEIDDLVRITGILMASDLVDIPAAVVALILVRQIYAMQMSHVRDLIQS